MKWDTFTFMLLTAFQLACAPSKKSTFKNDIPFYELSKMQKDSISCEEKKAKVVDSWQGLSDQVQSYLNDYEINYSNYADINRLESSNSLHDRSELENNYTKTERSFYAYYDRLKQEVEEYQFDKMVAESRYTFIPEGWTKEKVYAHCALYISKDYRYIDKYSEFNDFLGEYTDSLYANMKKEELEHQEKQKNNLEKNSRNENNLENCAKFNPRQYNSTISFPCNQGETIFYDVIGMDGDVKLTNSSVNNISVDNMNINSGTYVLTYGFKKDEKTNALRFVKP